MECLAVVGRDVEVLAFALCFMLRESVWPSAARRFEDASRSGEEIIAGRREL